MTSLKPKPKYAGLFLLLLLATSQGAEKGAVSWKSEADYRASEKEVVRKASWIIENPFSEQWGDSLRYVLEWGNGVPYLLFEVNGPYEKQITDAGKHRIMLRIGSAMLVGSIKYGIEHQANISKKEMAKNGLFSAAAYYKKIIVGRDDSRIRIMESIVKEIEEDSLKAYVEKFIEN